MIIAKFEIDESKKQASVHINGHARQADVGKDIVCASASILAYTLAQNVIGLDNRGLLKYDPTIKLKEGNAIIRCRAKTDESYAEILHLFVVIQTGYQLLAHNYPQFVAIEMFGDTE